MVLPAQVDLGEKVNLVGNLKALGDWNPNEGPSLKWHEGHNWQMTLNVPVGTEVNFKVRSTDHVILATPARAQVPARSAGCSCA